MYDNYEDMLTKAIQSDFLYLVLLVIYLSGWPEDSPNEPGAKEYRAWRGYDLRVLNKLEKEGLIKQSSSSLTFTDKGKTYAEHLKKEYGEFFKRLENVRFPAVKVEEKKKYNVEEYIAYHRKKRKLYEMEPFRFGP